jgi:hypothetical protein
MKIAQAKSAAGPAARLRDAPIELGTTLRRERKTWQVNMPEEKKKHKNITANQIQKISEAQFIERSRSSPIMSKQFIGPQGFGGTT